MPMIALSASTALLRAAFHCSAPIQPSCRPFLPSKGSIYSRYLCIWPSYWLLRWAVRSGQSNSIQVWKPPFQRVVVGMQYL